jgi:hypothetical protein
VAIFDVRLPRPKELAGRRRAGLETDPRLRALIPQERVVLARIAEGLTNRQIGEAMSLAEKTAKNLHHLGARQDGPRTAHPGGGVCGAAPVDPRLAAPAEGPAAKEANGRLACSDAVSAVVACCGQAVAGVTVRHGA